jgi:acetyl esterase/lipase
MKLTDYPQQEPLSEAGAAYGAECLRRGEGIEGEEHAYGDDPYQRLLVFRAASPDGRVLLFWHGGGWTSGYKEWMSFMAPAFTAAGVTFVTAGYRLAPGHLFPTGVQDCVAGLKWVAERIAGFGGDPNRIFIGGHSAGGHYAAMIATDPRWLQAQDMPVGIVKGCLPLSGVFAFGPTSGLSARPRFLGPDDRHETAASPVKAALGPPTPPFLVAYGTRDFPHLVTQGAAFAAALRQAGATVQEIAMPERTHFTASYAGGEKDGPWVQPALAFMARN